LRFLIAALLVGMSAISAHAKTVLACLDENVTGFHYKRNKYEPTVFVDSKLLVTIDGDRLTMKRRGKTYAYICRSPYITHPESKKCSDNFDVFSINTKTLRYTRAMTLGHLSDLGTASLVIAYGECTKFGDDSDDGY